MLYWWLRDGRAMDPKEVILMLLMVFVAITISFGLHEFAHALAAHLLGDDTAKAAGRLTINPFAHTDLMGTILILLVGFGWGKPVPINYSKLNKLKNRKASAVIVALAGVAMNFVIALVGGIINAILMARFFNEVTYIICTLISYIQAYSLMHMAFNLIPVAPLDGYRVIYEILPYKTRNSRGFMLFTQYGPTVLFVLILIANFGSGRFDLLRFIIDKIEYPAVVVINYVSDFIYGILR